jgi:acyl-CoA hydrolase
VIVEYGVAYLQGQTMRERCQALIKIAHPKYREDLKSDARDRNLL